MWNKEGCNRLHKWNIPKYCKCTRKFHFHARNYHICDADIFHKKNKTEEAWNRNMQHTCIGILNEAMNKHEENNTKTPWKGYGPAYCWLKF